MPNVARIVFSGSRPISGRSVTICNAAPKIATISADADQRQPETSGGGEDDDADIGAEHEQFAVGEVHHVHDAEDQRQPGGDQRQDHAGDDAVHRLDDDEIQRDGVEELADRAHRSHSQILLDDRVVTSISDAAQWWRTLPFSMM